MERIKEAIEKAKREQQLGRDQQAPKRVERPLEPHEAQEIPEPHESNLRRVRYRQTKVVELDNEHLGRNRIFAHNKNNPMTQSIDLLRTQVLQMMDENDWRTLAITSPTPEAGKSVVAINLAMSIARHTQKTSMLVDFDLRRPRVASYLGLDVRKHSLISMLKDKAELADVMINPGIRHFVVIPTARPIANPAEALASKKVTDLIHDLRNRYDSRIVIFDMAPLLNVDDTLAVLPQMDCALLVVGNGMSTKREIEESMGYLQSVNLLGVVLNKAEEEVKSYYY